MCIGLPGQIVSVDGSAAEVDFGGTRRTISLLTLPEVGVNDWIVAHSGFAVKQLSADEANQNIDCIVEALDSEQ